MAPRMRSTACRSTGCGGPRSEDWSSESAATSSRGPWASATIWSSTILQGKFAVQRAARVDGVEGGDVVHCARFGHVGRRFRAVFDYRRLPRRDRSRVSAGPRRSALRADRHGGGAFRNHARPADRRDLRLGIHLRHRCLGAACARLDSFLRLHRADDEAVDSHGKNCPPRPARQPGIRRRSVGTIERRPGDVEHGGDDPRRDADPATGAAIFPGPQGKAASGLPGRRRRMAACWA